MRTAAQNRFFEKVRDFFGLTSRDPHCVKRACATRGGSAAYLAACVWALLCARERALRCV